MKRPMRPVDMTPTIRGSNPSSVAVTFFISIASSIPRRPVSALALPLFTTTACSLSEFSFIITCTGAALTLLLVNPAHAVAGTSEYKRARSSERYLTPLCTPAALKPCGVVTPPSITSTILIPPIREGSILSSHPVRASGSCTEPPDRRLL